MKRANGPLIAVCALLLILFSGEAAAHAVLQSADPSPNGHAEWGVAEVEIRFTEDVEREYTQAEVRGLDQGIVSIGTTEFDEAESNVIRVPTQPLVDGIYVVNWRTLSVDTHTARGSFVFSVGNATLKFTDEVKSHEHAEHSLEVVQNEGIARGLFYMGVFASVGVPAFALVILRKGDTPRRLAAPPAILGLVGAAAGLYVLQSLASRIAAPVEVAAGTDAGTFLVARSGALALAAACGVAAYYAPEKYRRLALAATGGLGVAALYLTASGSHAAALREQTALAVAADLVHLTAASIWVGGLVSFALVLSTAKPPEAGRLVTRFSPIAVGSVAAILLTGTYAAWLHVGTVDRLLSADYGLLVILKASLILPLICLGAYNQYKLGPRLLLGEASSPTLRRVVAVELSLLLIVVGAAGLLASTAPPSADVETGTQGPVPLELAQETKTTHVVLSIRPNPVTVGIQRVSLALHPLSSEPLPNSTEVGLKFAPPGTGEPETIVIPERVRENQWVIEDAFFTEPGVWQVYVIMQRPDEFKKLEFEVEVVEPDSGGSRGD